MTLTVRRAAACRALPVACAALLAAGCWAASGGAPDVAVPSPRGEAARTCRDLAGALPERVSGEERGDLPERTPYAAVWGDPAIVLRCGVPEPAVLRADSDVYNPLADAVKVNGVSWLLEEEPDGMRFTTTHREVHVEVTVPDDYAPEVNPLTDLAAPVDRHVPLDALCRESPENC
jgi:hypothetical protein